MGQTHPSADSANPGRDSSSTSSDDEDLPIADAGGPYSGIVGTDLPFKASQSAQIVEYAWQFGDGASATGATVSHTFDRAENFIVSLTVTDDQGHTSTVTTTATILKRNRCKTWWQKLELWQQIVLAGLGAVGTLFAVLGPLGVFDNLAGGTVGCDRNIQCLSKQCVDNICSCTRSHPTCVDDKVCNFHRSECVEDTPGSGMGGEPCEGHTECRSGLCHGLEELENPICQCTNNNGRGNYCGHGSFCNEKEGTKCINSTMLFASAETGNSVVPAECQTDLEDFLECYQDDSNDCKDLDFHAFVDMVRSASKADAMSLSCNKWALRVCRKMEDGCCEWDILNTANCIGKGLVSIKQRINQFIECEQDSCRVDSVVYPGEFCAENADCISNVCGEDNVCRCTKDNQCRGLNEKCVTAQGVCTTKPPAPMWGPSTRIGHNETESEVSNYMPKIAMAPIGNAYMTFYGKLAIWARRYVAATKTWDPLTQINDSGSSGVNPLVAVDDSGNAIVAWYQGGVARPVFARKFTASLGWPMGWGIVETVAPGGGASTKAYISGLSMTGDGHACVCWRVWDSSADTWKAFLRVWEEGRDWDVPITVSGSSITAFQSDCAITKVGNYLRVVSYFSELGEPRHSFGVIYNYSLSTHTGMLGEPTALETETMLDVDRGQVGVDAAGTAFVAMERGSSATGTILVNRYTGSWSGPTGINPTLGATTFKLRVHHNGEAWIVWRQSLPTNAIWGRLYSAGAWQPTAQISADDNYVGYSSIDMDSSGNAIAVWRGRVAGVDSIFANEYSATGGWGIPHLLEEDLDITHTGPVDVGFENSVAVAAWLRKTETPVSRSKIFGAIYQ